jgi:hypothetical protein
MPQDGANMNLDNWVKRKVVYINVLNVLNYLIDRIKKHCLYNQAMGNGRTAVDLFISNCGNFVNRYTEENFIKQQTLFIVSMPLSMLRQRLLNFCNWQLHIRDPTAVCYCLYLHWSFENLQVNPLKCKTLPWWVKSSDIRQWG